MTGPNYHSFVNLLGISKRFDGSRRIDALEPWAKTEEDEEANYEEDGYRNKSDD
jgi:hypothetical protein